MVSNAPNRVTARGKKVIKMPYGSILVNSTHLNDSCIKTINNLKTLVKEESLLVLDAHLMKIDIFASAAAITENLVFRKILMPVASSGYYLPIINRGYENLNKLKEFEFYPVFRKEDRSHVSNKISWKLFNKSLNAAETLKLNKRYIERSLEVLEQKNNLIVVAPFGDNSTFGQEVRKGVRILMQTGVPTVCTYSKFNWKDLRFEVFVSDVLRFDPTMNELQIREVLNSTYSGLASAHRAREASIFWSIYKEDRRKSLAFYRGPLFLFGLTKRVYYPIVKLFK